MFMVMTRLAAWPEVLLRWIPAFAGMTWWCEDDQVGGVAGGAVAVDSRLRGNDRRREDDSDNY